jgi:uncharacterized protein YbbK (DUF523 family)
MPIVNISLQDTFDQWRQKDNQMINQINTLAASGSVVNSSSPAAGQMLIYDGTFFRNVNITGDISVTSNGVVSVIGGGTGNSKGRIRFAGSITGLY